MAIVAPPVFVLAPRYARDLGAALADRRIDAEIVQNPARAAALAMLSMATIAVVDARGAMAAALLAAHELGPIFESRRGGMLVLLGRGDIAGVAAARAAGATQVLMSPFGAAELGEAIGFARRLVERLAAAAGGEGVLGSDLDVHRDSLTGLATGNYALGWLRALIGSGNAPPVVLLVGVGRFAAINAAHGQPAADALLRAVGERLSRVIAEAQCGGGGCLVARMAGAEFAVVLPAPMTLGEAVRTAQLIVSSFDTPFASDSRIVHLGVRIGVAITDTTAIEAGLPDAGDSSGLAGSLETAGIAERTFRQAGSALAVARAGPPGGIEVFAAGPDSDDPLARRADLESDLRRAIAEDGIDLVYQPQVAIAPGGGSAAIAGVEALVRWNHPVFGPLSAETLLEIANHAEIGAELGVYIRARAMREAMAWPEALSRLQLSVNVTASDLRAADFTDALDAALVESGLPPHRLMLEITEGDLIENLDVAAVALRSLRERGVRVALDDFGTGYSSLAYLKALPLDALKLDKALTRDLGGTQRDRVVVRVVVALARALGIRVVAEGVETEADLALVTAARCDWYQGFLCAPALAPGEVGTFVMGWDGGAYAGDTPAVVEARPRLGFTAR